MQYPDDGTDATDHLRPSALQQKTIKLSDRFLANVDCIMEWNGGIKKKIAFLPFTAGQLAADSKTGTGKWIRGGGYEGQRVRKKANTV